MNTFTETQLRVITDLAGEYWESRPNMFGFGNIGDFGPEIRAAAKEDYIKNIIKGLRDPEWWG